MHWPSPEVDRETTDVQMLWVLPQPRFAWLISWTYPLRPSAVFFTTHSALLQGEAFGKVVSRHDLLSFPGLYRHFFGPFCLPDGNSRVSMGSMRVDSSREYRKEGYAVALRPAVDLA
jgi:hypothetical protein